MRKLRTRGSLKLLTALLLAPLLGGCAAFTERSTGLTNDQLSDCPAWPRCVSSVEPRQQRQVKPLLLAVPAEQAWPRVRAAVAAMPRTTIVDEQPNYLHAEVVSPWGTYVDDLELHLQPDDQRVEIRSSGRIGYYDFNVNRDRVEALRATLIQQGVVTADHARQSHP